MACLLRRVDLDQVSTVQCDQYALIIFQETLIQLDTIHVDDVSRNFVMNLGNVSLLLDTQRTTDQSR